MKDEFIVNVFVQKYYSECNKDFMIGTTDYPFRLVGELVSYRNHTLVVRQEEDDTVCCAPVMHYIFSQSLINLSINVNGNLEYLVGFDFVKERSYTDGKYLYTEFSLKKVVEV